MSSVQFFSYSWQLHDAIFIDPANGCSTIKTWTRPEYLSHSDLVTALELRAAKAVFPDLSREPASVHLSISQAAEEIGDVCKREHRGEAVHNRFIFKLWNTYAFFVNYARLDGFELVLQMLHIAGEVELRAILELNAVGRVEPDEVEVVVHPFAERGVRLGETFERVFGVGYLRKTVSGFTHGAQQSDDITMVFLRRLE